jgi:hypothetical protein
MFVRDDIVTLCGTRTPVSYVNVPRERVTYPLGPVAVVSSTTSSPIVFASASTVVTLYVARSDTLAALMSSTQVLPGASSPGFTKSRARKCSKRRSSSVTVRLGS